MDAPLNRLINILDEKIKEEKHGIESYNAMIGYVKAIKLPRHIERDILDYLYKIVADEEIHADTLTVVRNSIMKIFK